jgi:hypothetical protein
MIKIAEQENAINESTEQSIETLMSKDSHGLWSSIKMKLILELDKQ